MKMGFRTPSPGRSFRASTSGRLTRSVKSVNPVYGKRGMGVINDPKRAAYNAVYSRATVGVNDTSGSEPNEPNEPNEPPNEQPQTPQNQRPPLYKKWWFWVILILIIAGAAGRVSDKKEEKVAEATPSPTAEPTPEPTPEPTEEPTPEPTKEPKKKSIIVYVAASGNGKCYHLDPDCSRMKGEVKKMKLKKARKKYRACSKCGGG